ncbi:hypothetical protein [Acidovorax sp. JHL-3]|nr:hypothetical protein [Acidovorax sp. JHL-3]
MISKPTLIACNGDFSMHRFLDTLRFDRFDAFARSASASERLTQNVR